MELKRFFANSIIDNKVMLDGDEFYHAVKVTRHKVGFNIIVCIGDGYDYYAKVVEIGKDYLLAETYQKLANLNESTCRITLFQALCKEFDFILQKAVELGCSAIYPVITKRSQPYTFNYQRLDKILQGAAKQCQRSRLPKLFMPITYQQATQISADNQTSILCYEDAEHAKISDYVDKTTQSLSLFIGSEGGFDSDEITLAKQNNIDIVTLGKRILRSETAAICSLGLTLNALGEM